jgi:hypothetical protein
MDPLEVIKRLKGRQRRYPPDELARRGEELYHNVIAPQLPPESKEQFVAIDIETGAYELDDDSFTATMRLLERLPDAQIWGVHIGRRWLFDRPRLIEDSKC